MPLVISHSIRAQEFGKRLSNADRNVLIRSARVALATDIAAKGLPPATRLLKAFLFLFPPSPPRLARAEPEKENDKEERE